LLESNFTHTLVEALVKTNQGGNEMAKLNWSHVRLWKCGRGWIQNFMSQKNKFPTWLVQFWNVNVNMRSLEHGQQL
jgi:hypothetical protein